VLERQRKPARRAVASSRGGVGTTATTGFRTSDAKPGDDQ
jgi:hypothetical protein